LVYLLIAYLLFLPHALINNFLLNFLLLNTISHYNRIKGVEEREIPVVRLHLKILNGCGKLCFTGASFSVDGCLLQTPIQGKHKS
jgi:hypothetical protein